MQDTNQIPAWLNAFFETQPKGQARATKTGVINDCMEKDDEGKWQLVLDDAKFEDVLFSIRKLKIFNCKFTYK